MFTFLCRRKYFSSLVFTLLFFFLVACSLGNLEVGIEPTFTPEPLVPAKLTTQADQQVTQVFVPGQIAFHSTHEGDTEIYVIEADGSRLTNSCKGAWSPDRERIVFTSTHEDSAGEIYVMKADGSEQTRLTYNKATDLNPNWSPDGKRIVFVSNRDSQMVDQFEIYVMNADSSEQTRLTNSSAGVMYPAWSPDGKHIVFASGGNGPHKSGIYIMNADGSEQTHLTNGKAWDGRPAWSPDGRQIAFTSNRNGLYIPEIYVMNADGSRQTRLTNNNSEDMVPVWSPNGKYIAFMSDRNYNKTQGRESPHDIYVMNADGSEQTRLTSSEQIYPCPVWLP